MKQNRRFYYDTMEKDFELKLKQQREKVVFNAPVGRFAHSVWDL